MLGADDRTKRLRGAGMACENCRYWKATYAPAIHKMIMTCTNDKTEDQSGRCKEFQRKKLSVEPKSTAIFRYKEGK